MRLLTNPKVQKELKLNGAQVENVASLAKDVAAKGRCGRSLSLKPCRNPSGVRRCRCIMTAV